MASKGQAATSSQSQIISICKATCSDVREREEEDDVPESLLVSSHVRIIPPVGLSRPLDREVVLRRIRQRRRVNSIPSALSSLFSSGKPADGDKAVKSDWPNRWIDDAYAAP